MTELKPKNPMTAQFIEEHLAGQSYKTAPAYKQYIGASEIEPHQYTTDANATGIVGAAVQVTFEDESVMYLDTDEVVL